MSANNAFMSEEEEEAQLNRLGLRSSLFYKLVPQALDRWFFRLPVFTRQGGRFVRLEGPKEHPGWGVYWFIEPKFFEKMRTCIVLSGRLWYGSFEHGMFTMKEPYTKDRHVYTTNAYLWRKPTWIHISPGDDMWINSHDIIRTIPESDEVLDEETCDVLKDLEAIERGDNSSTEEEDDDDGERKTSVQTRSRRRPLKRNLSDSHKDAVQKLLNKPRKPRHG